MRRRAAAVRRRHHALLGDPDPAHPQDHDGDHARHPRAPAARRRPGGRWRLRLEAQRLRRGAALRGPRPASTACPVRWIEERSENALATIHGRGQIQDIELAADADGKLTAAAGRACSPTWAPTCSSSRPASRCSARSSTPASTTCPRPTTSRAPVFTTMTPTDAYRGAGRPEATYAIERAMDALAAQGRHRPGRAAPAQLHPHRRVPVHRVDRAGVRLRRPRRRGRQGARDGRLRRAARRAARPERRRGHQAPRHRRVVLLRDVRPRPVAGAGLAELLGRRLGGGHGARAARPARCRSSPAPRRTARATRRRGR